MFSMGKIVIIGSSNTDLVVKTEHIPASGETVMGNNLMIASGGKGANQAVAAKRLGGDVVFVAKLGKDFFGDNVFSLLMEEGFAPQYLMREEDSASGVALVKWTKPVRTALSSLPGQIIPGQKMMSTVSGRKSLLLKLFFCNWKYRWI